MPQAVTPVYQIPTQTIVKYLDGMVIELWWRASVYCKNILTEATCLCIMRCRPVPLGPRWLGRTTIGGWWMSKNPKVSIGFPVRNGGPLLAEAIDSILAQTF